ncbi:alpha/beta hydrolase [Halostagnicola sp. A56]|uniref:alpha/beta hydrolase n=1 Tax=Halostagnicola sp. A56 TaxID=1495067 RepID=UPI00049FE2B1|nr:alpha/beta hydrolase [Halostagnicola sp. A56]KDE58171.1 alpha/beta hydrolase [Halostagnicola sp. A56]
MTPSRVDDSHAASRAEEPHPDVQAFLEVYESLDAPDFSEVTPETAREQFSTMLEGGDPAVELPAVEDRSIDGSDGEIPIRLYEPSEDPNPDRPLILYFHGGGWVIGSVDTHDGSCRKLAAESGYPVVSVDYRLAPEHPFPAGLRDCYAALEWAEDVTSDRDTADDGGDTIAADSDRIVLAGDSAGGNLAAATALLARDRGGPDIAAQLLIYPPTGDATETESYEENGEGYFLTAEEMAWFEDHYFADDIQQGNVYTVPRRAADLSELPPATILTAGFDPLRDDGAAYADRLEAAGVPVTSRNYDDMIHGFFGMVREPANFERAHEAYDDAIADLRARLE